MLALENMPAVRLGTARLPSRTSVESSDASLDRKNRAVDADATVGAGPMLRIELKMLSVPPVETGLGVAVTAATMRSGVATVMAALAPTLLVSSSSKTLLSASATTRTKYVPSDVLAAMLSTVLALEKAPVVRLDTARLASRTAEPSKLWFCDR